MVAMYVSGGIVINEHEYTGRGQIPVLCRYEEFDSPINAENVVQATIDGTTYVVTETIGFVDPDTIRDPHLMEHLHEGQCITFLNDDESPHTGRFCEITGEMFDEPWYVVTWTDSYDEPALYHGGYDAINGFLAEVESLHDSEVWMLAEATISATVNTSPTGVSHGEIRVREYQISLSRNGEVNVHTADNEVPARTNSDNVETYAYKWQVGNFDDPNSPMQVLIDFVTELESTTILHVSASATMVREDFSGRFYVSVSGYDQ